MHRHTDTVTHYTAMLTHAWDRLSDHHQLDTDRAKRILDLQNQLERLDVRLIADPTNPDIAQQLEELFGAIDDAVGPETVDDTYTVERDRRPRSTTQPSRPRAMSPDTAPSIPLEASEADALEQQHPITDHDDDPNVPEDLPVPLDADPADVLDQHRPVPIDDDERSP